MTREIVVSGQEPAVSPSRGRVTDALCVAIGVAYAVSVASALTAALITRPPLSLRVAALAGIVVAETLRRVVARRLGWPPNRFLPVAHVANWLAIAAYAASLVLALT